MYLEINKQGYVLINEKDGTVLTKNMIFEKDYENVKLFWHEDDIIQDLLPVFPLEGDLKDYSIRYWCFSINESEYDYLNKDYIVNKNK